MFYDIPVCYCIFLYHTCFQCLIYLNTKVGAKEVHFRQYKYQYLFLTSPLGNLVSERTFFFLVFREQRNISTTGKSKWKKIILCVHFRVCLCYPSTIVYDLKVIAHRGYKKTYNVGNPGPGLGRYKNMVGFNCLLYQLYRVC